MESLIKFVKTPSSYIVCSMCGKVFSDPVINVKCGHTFCKRCLEESGISKDGLFFVRCPEDGTECRAIDLVRNIAIEGEVADQDVFCRFGLQLSKEEDALVTDPVGCTAIIKYGSIKQHEAVCEYALIPCPNSGSVHSCGVHRRRSMDKHSEICRYIPCPHRNKGCVFAGDLSEVIQHSVLCENRSSPQVSAVEQKQIEKLLSSQNAIEEKVESLAQRVKLLEEHKVLQSSLLDTQSKLLEQLTTRVDDVYNMLRKLTTASSPAFQDNSLSLKLKDGLLCLDDKPSIKSALVCSRMNEASQRTASVSLTLSGGMKMETWEMPFQFKCIGTLRSHKGGVLCLRAYKTRVYSCGSDCNIKVWDLDDLVQGCKHSQVAHSQRVLATAVNSRHLYSAGEDLTIKSWHLSSLTLDAHVEMAHEQLIAALACTEEFLFSSSLSVIRVWHGETLCPIHVIQNLHHWVRSLALSPHMTELYSGSHGVVDIWDLTSGKFGLSGKITHAHGSVYSLAVTAKYIIVGTYNQNIHVFDAVTRQYIIHLMGHVGIINSIATSPSGRFMFSASSDSSVMVWSLDKMLPIQTLQRHNDSVNALVVSGDLLMSGSEDSEIKVFKYFRMQMGFVSTGI